MLRPRDHGLRGSPITPHDVQQAFALVFVPMAEDSSTPRPVSFVPPDTDVARAYFRLRIRVNRERIARTTSRRRTATRNSEGIRFRRVSRDPHHRKEMRTVPGQTGCRALTRFRMSDINTRFTTGAYANRTVAPRYRFDRLFGARPIRTIHRA